MSHNIASWQGQQDMLPLLSSSPQLGEILLVFVGNWPSTGRKWQGGLVQVPITAMLPNTCAHTCPCPGSFGPVVLVSSEYRSPLGFFPMLPPEWSRAVTTQGLSTGLISELAMPESFLCFCFLSSLDFSQAQSSSPSRQGWPSKSLGR